MSTDEILLVGLVAYASVATVFCVRWWFICRKIDRAWREIYARDLAASRAIAPGSVPSFVVVALAVAALAWVNREKLKKIFRRAP